MGKLTVDRERSPLASDTVLGSESGREIDHETIVRQTCEIIGKGISLSFQVFREKGY
jgi:hypothetical protein